MDFIKQILNPNPMRSRLEALAEQAKQLYGA